MTSFVKNPPANAGDAGSILGQEDHLEEEIATRSSILAWKIPWIEEPGGLQSMGSLRVRHTEQLHFHFSLSCIGEGNGNPLQYSCLENPRGGRAWWAAVYGVAQSRTWLKWLSRYIYINKSPTITFMLSCQKDNKPLIAFIHPIWQCSTLMH